MKPIEGAETEGAVGFFKGIGKGLVGRVTKHYSSLACFLTKAQSCDKASRWCL